MNFEMDNALIDDILFHMENQDGNFILDTHECTVVSANGINPDDGRYISLPVWNSNDGFRLMEKFTLSLKNPAARSELSDSLNKNKGVFRAFRDVLEQYPEIEKHWFKFKEQKMKNLIIDWYNALREEWGLEPIGAEPEDTSSLVLEDFIFEEETLIDPFGFLITAKTNNEEYAGEICAYISKGVLYVETFIVYDEYKGMGLGKTLLAKLIKTADEEKLDVSIDVPAKSDFFTRSLLLENFKPVTQTFVRRTGSAD
ncbi:MAG: UPF0158 family protein [Treponema sp.]|nr:UPF0158 family protein [Treponema sp.]